MFNNRPLGAQYGGMQRQFCGPTNVNQRLSIEEIEFEKEFSSWDQGFNEWKEEYSGHPDKAAYLTFERKFIDVRDRLVMRRAELKIKHQLRRNARPQSSFASDLSTATAAAESILSQFGSGPGPRTFPNHPDRPPLYGNRNMNQTNFSPRFQPHMNNQKSQKIPRPTATPSKLEVENPMKYYEDVMNEAKNEECPKRLPGSHTRKYKILKEKPETSWNEEEKLFMKMYIYVTRKRNEHLFKEREKKRALEGGNTSSSTEQSTQPSQYGFFVSGGVYDPNHQTSQQNQNFSNDMQF